MSRRDNALFYILFVLLPIIGVILYWCGTYHVWNALLTSTDVGLALANLLLFALLFIIGIIITIGVIVFEAIILVVTS